jgi:hypothetical protein
MKRDRTLLFIIFTSMMLMISSRATVPNRYPLPKEFGDTAQIPKIPWAKFWGDEAPPFSKLTLGQPREKIMKSFPKVFGTEHNYWDKGPPGFE